MTGDAKNGTGAEHVIEIAAAAKMASLDPRRRRLAADTQAQMIHPSTNQSLASRVVRNKRKVSMPETKALMNPG